MIVPLRINSDRLWRSLTSMAAFGATPGGGVSRLALSKEDKLGRDTLREWAQQDGFSCEADALGNMFIRRPGRNPALAPVMTGSHADSQPMGGNYDGIYGVLAGLEVLQGTLPVKAFALHACYELHIEQGPVLEEEQIDIGVVHGAMGQRWFDITLTGFAAHAGTTPMSLRRDALCGFAELVLAVESIGNQFSEEGRATIGMANITPNSRNVVPGNVVCSVEIRHPDRAMLVKMEEALLCVLEKLNGRHLTFRSDKIFDYAPVIFDAHCIQHITQAAEKPGYSQRKMVSGAGHDACYVNRVAPAAMIFIPCVQGISHNEEEKIYPEWSEKGANVLLHTLLKSANEAL